MKPILIIIAVLTLAACQPNDKKVNQENQGFGFYVGTYTDTISQGIYRYLLLNDGTLKRISLAAKTVNPSFLTMTADKKYLVAVNEINKDGAGTVESYLITGDSLSIISRSSSGGAHPCFVSVNDANFVLVANYTGGNMGLLRLNDKGELTNLLDVEQHTGHGTTERQQSPHVHSAWFLKNSNKIISVDLGTNELWFSKLDAIEQKLKSLNPPTLKMNDGAGPRHLTFHPNRKWIYVINELDFTVTMIKKNDDGKYEKGNSVSSLPVGFTEPNTSADIHISSDGKFLYASNRGHNSIAIFEVNSTDGSLKLIANESTRGKAPRNFSLSPDENYLLVANQLTSNIVSFKRDKNTGLLSYAAQIDAPTPVCILFN